MTTASTAVSVANGLSWAGTVIATQMLFDAITRAAVGQIGFWDCVPSLLALAGASFGQQIFEGIYLFLIRVVHGKCAGYFKAMLHRKLLRVDPALFEATAFLDDLNKGRESAFIITYFCLLLQGIPSFYMVYFVTVGAYLFRLKPLLLVTLVAAFVPAMLAQVVRGRVFTALEGQSAPLRRQHEYYQKTLCDREYFKETRILGAFMFFHKRFVDTLALLTRKVWQAERKTALLQLLLNMSSFAGMAVSVYLLFSAAMAGEITVGAFAAVFASLGQLFFLMQELVAGHIGNMNRDLGKATNFLRVLDFPERTGTDEVLDFTKGIVAENISFTYPDRDEAAVCDLSLSIAEGETIAIVGENGAGKSTLVRLLTGIYLPTKGVVTIGGLDTAKAVPQQLFKQISGVFQKFQRYKMTLEANVAISDVHADKNPVKIEAALREADAALGLALDTVLSPEFDGIDLSGGQWQRVAIARGLYRRHGFIVLDEPTSAIDPIEEARVYAQFQRLAKSKCAVVVTHRLGSAKLAHRIIVMDGGKIVDTGTHAELLSRPGKYAEMWAAQAKWYERENAAPAHLRSL